MLMHVIKKKSGSARRSLRINLSSDNNADARSAGSGRWLVRPSPMKKKGKKNQQIFAVIAGPDRGSSWLWCSCACTSLSLYLLTLRSPSWSSRSWLHNLQMVLFASISVCVCVGINRGGEGC